MKEKKKKRNSGGIQLLSCSRKFPRSWKWREWEAGTSGISGSGQRKGQLTMIQLIG